MGRSFKAQVLKEVLKLYGIRKTHSTAFNPRPNGKKEIFTKILKQHLCMLVKKPKGLASALAQNLSNLPQSATQQYIVLPI